MTSEQCSQWTNAGGCPNKVAAVKPHKHSWVGPEPLCGKHAKARALMVLAQYPELVWALKYLGMVNDDQ